MKRSLLVGCGSFTAAGEIIEVFSRSNLIGWHYNKRPKPWIERGSGGLFIGRLSIFLTMDF